MAINSTSWRRMPIADRDQAFNADMAAKRIGEWAKGSAERYASAFLWRNPQGPPNHKNSYRLPVADVMDGKLYVIPHAIFTAAAILSGAHGGLEGVVGDEEKLKLKGVITEIYAVLSEKFGDPRVKPPWLRGGNEPDQVTASLAAAVNSAGWSKLPVANMGHSWDGSAAKMRLWQWADGDFRNYRKGFLWWDNAAPDRKGSYKLPIADVVDGSLTIVPRAVNAVAAVLAGARGGVDIPDDDMDQVEAVVNKIQERFGEDDSEDNSRTAAAAPTAPPRDWFDDPKLMAPTPVAVSPDGRVVGHLAAWGTCHTAFGDKCVMAPRSATDYKYFRNGSVLTADGSLVKVGKITLGTGHANTRLGWVPAADHYDNTGTQVAIVAAGEDRHGIWVAGALVPEAGEETAAALRRSPLSGDWRRINGNLELVAALAVNAPGFPVMGLNASGEPEALCAAGIVLEDGTINAIATEDAPPIEPVDRRALERLDHLQAYVDTLIKRGRARRLKKLQGGKDGM